MSRKSRHEKSMVYVKYVQDLTNDEWEKSPLFASIRSAIANKGSSDGFRLNVTLDNGKLVQKKFREIKWGKGAFEDSFSEEYTLVAVKLVFSDGTSDYGFKVRESKTIVNKKNAILEPIFIREGIWSEYDCGFVECPKNVISTRKIPAWMLKRLPMYCEKIRDRILAKKRDSGCKYVSDDTFESALHQVMTSDLVSNWTIFGKPPSGAYKGNEKVAYKVCSAFGPDSMMSRRGWNVQDPFEYDPYTGKFTMEQSYHPVGRNPLDYYVVTEMTNGESEVEIEKMDRQKSRLIEEMPKNVVYLYKYLKSIYRDKVSRRKVYGIMPMGNVLNIERVHYWNDENAEEVWNNLDATCAGNI